MAAPKKRLSNILLHVPTKNELTKLEKKKLIKKGKKYNVKWAGTKAKTADKIIKKIVLINNKRNSKKNKKRKKKKRANTEANIQLENVDNIRKQNESRTSVASLQLSVSQPNTNLLCTVQPHETESQLPALSEDKEDDNTYKNQTFPQLVNKLSNSSNDPSHHKRNSSELHIILQAPKKQYKINGIRLFDSIKDIKAKIPIKNIECGQCKLFYAGNELNDNQTLSQLDIHIPVTCKFKLLISWNYFRPDQSLPHPKKMEHKHLNKIRKLTKINNFNYFTRLMRDILNQHYNIKHMHSNILSILHKYCLYLSGNRTHERQWTKLHSMCYDYQNDVGKVVELLKKHNVDNKDKKQNLYIDAWPHSGTDTPLIMAINRAVPNQYEDEKINEINAEGAVQLVEVLVFHGARRMIRRTVVNLQRVIDDALYKGMNVQIRQQFVHILKPYIDEDPYKPI